MPELLLPTQTMSVSDAKDELSQLVDAVARRDMRVLIEKDGIPVAAIVSAQDHQRLAQFDQQREELFQIIEQMREAFKDVPPEEIEREADRSVAEARERLRQRRYEAAMRSA